MKLTTYSMLVVTGVTFDVPAAQRKRRKTAAQPCFLLPTQSGQPATGNQVRAERAGTGTPANAVPRGQLAFRERVDFGETIGDFVKDGTATPTTSGIIHYGKGGIHIVPAAPN